MKKEKKKKNCFSCKHYWFEEGMYEYPDEAENHCRLHDDEIIEKETSGKIPYWKWDHWHRCYEPKEVKPTWEEI